MAALAMLLAACSPADRAIGDGAPVEVPRIDASAADAGPSALLDPADAALPAPLVDVDQIRSGGVPPDGIPSIDRPRFVRAEPLRWLREREPVLALSIGDDARAYPVQIMTWHEIVNDTVDGVPVAITYCPLCNSAIAFDRRLPDGRILELGTSGSLLHSAMVMYDRQTESLWAHFTGQAVAGRLTGTTLEAFPVSTVSYGEFLKAHPTGLVLSRDTGFDREYGVNPYPGYDDVGSPPFLYRGRVDGRLAAKERVVGLVIGGEAVAVERAAIAGSGVFEPEVAGTPLTFWHRPGTASGLDDSQIDQGREIGSITVHDRRIDGRVLSFTADGSGFTDRETGSRWSSLGTATSGPLAGRSLTPIAHIDTFWFAWAAYQPRARLLPERSG